LRAKQDLARQQQLEADRLALALQNKAISDAAQQAHIQAQKGKWDLKSTHTVRTLNVLKQDIQSY